MNPSVGAAESGFDGDYARLQAQNTKVYAPGANPTELRTLEDGTEVYQDLSVPTQDFNGKTVSKSASTVHGAKAVPAPMVETLRQEVANGNLSVDTVTDKAALNRAKETVKRIGLDAAMEQFRNKVEAFKGAKDTTVLGQVLLNQVANGDSQNLFAEVLSLYRTINTNLAQGLQAMALFRKLDPAAQLHGIKTIITNMNNKLGNDGKAQKQAKKTKKNLKIKAEEELNAMRESRDVAYDLITHIHEAFSERDHGIPVEDWVREIGDRLAKAVKASKPSRAAQQNITKTIQADLMKFAESFLPGKTTTQTAKRTATERLTDFYANRENYTTAWKRAQATFLEQNKDNQDVLDRYEEWTQGTMDYNGIGTDNVMTAAIVESMIASDMNLRQTAMRAKLADVDATVSQIADTLIAETGAVGADAALIQQATARFVEETNLEYAAQSEKSLDADTLNTLKDMGQTLSKVIKEGAATRQDLANKIASTLVKDYGISNAGARVASNLIVDRFNQAVATKSREYLENQFKDSDKEKTTKTRAKRFEEMANMGAFTTFNFNKLATEYAFGFEELTLGDALAQKFLDQTTQEGRDAVMEEIYRDLGAQLPSSFADKFNAMRYMAMLTNPTTHVRNNVGNLAMIPLRMVKNELGAVIESTMAAAGVDVERTKSIAYSPKMYKAAMADYDNVKDMMKGSRYEDAKGEIQQHKVVFKGGAYDWFGGVLGKGFEGLRTGNLNALEWEDGIAKRINYAAALSGYLTANKVTTAQFQNGAVSDALLGEARGLTTLQDYTILKQAAQCVEIHESLTTLQDYTILKRARNADGKWRGLTTLQDYTILKRNANVNSKKSSLTTLQDYTILKPTSYSLQLWICLTTLQDYTILKRRAWRLPGHRCLTTLQDYTILKRSFFFCISRHMFDYLTRLHHSQTV